jgi:hypothetical protein
MSWSIPGQRVPITFSDDQPVITTLRSTDGALELAVETLPSIIENWLKVGGR